MPRATTLGEAGRATYVDHTRPDDALDPAGEFTVEAWVRLGGARATEPRTIVAAGDEGGHFLAVRPDFGLVFGRGASTAAAPAGLRLLPGRWHHVAAVVRASSVTFVLDGRSAAVAWTDPGPTPSPSPLFVGARRLRVGGLLLARGDFFHGDVQLVRLWSTARSLGELGATRFRQDVAGPSLILSTRDGGTVDAASGRRGAVVECTGGVIGQRCEAVAVAAPTVVDGVLPQRLDVPRTAIHPVVDGQLDALAYAGADRVAWPSSVVAPLVRDAQVAAVHDDESLYLHLGALTVLDAFGTEPTRVEVYLQTERGASSAGLPAAGDVRISVELLGEIVTQVTVTEADGAGGYRPLSPPDAVEVEVAVDPFETATNFAVELRASGSRLGPLDGVDGLAVLWQDAERALSWSAGTSPLDTATWADVRYGEGAPGLGALFGRVRVIDGTSALGGPGLPGAPVRLFAGASLLVTRTVDAAGVLDLSELVPLGVPLTLAVGGGCADGLPWEPAQASVPALWTRLTSTEASGLVARDPVGTLFGEVRFYQRCPIPAATVTDQRPGVQATVARDATHPVGPMTIEGSGAGALLGERLHDRLRYYLASNRCTAFPPTACPDTIELRPLPVVAGDPRRCGDGAAPERCVSLDLTEPAVERLCGVGSGGRCALWLRDPWARPGVSEWQNVGPLRVDAPPYEALYSLGFQNDPGEMDYGKEFRLMMAGLADTAYFDLGPCSVPDPLAVLYALASVAIVNASADGSCVGMAAMSNLFALGVHRPDDFERGARYPVGLLDPPNTFPLDLEGPAPRGRTGVDVAVCQVPRPTNLFGHVRMYHQLQGSAEFLGEILAGSLPEAFTPCGDFVFGGSPARTFCKIERGERAPDYLLAMSRIGGGHVVAPLGVVRDDPDFGDFVRYVDNTVVYWGRFNVSDNRVDGVRPFRPDFLDTYRAGVGLATNTYTRYRRNNAMFKYRGLAGLYAVPTRVLLDAPSVPGFGSFVRAGTVFGGDAEHASVSGERLGWRSDDEFASTTSEATAWFPAATDDDGSVRDFFAAAASTAALARTAVRRRAGAYVAQVSGDGRLLQWRVASARRGAPDALAWSRDAALRFDGARIDVGAPARVTPALALTPRDGARAAFSLAEWPARPGEAYRVAAVQGGGSVGVRVDADGGTPVLTHVVARLVDVTAGVAAQHLLGPVLVPAGGAAVVRYPAWPEVGAAELLVDADGDGRFESARTVAPEPCGSALALPDAPPDSGPGIPPACAARADASVQAALCGPRGRPLLPPALRGALCTHLADVDGDGDVGTDDVQALLRCVTSDVDGDGRVDPRDAAQCLARALQTRRTRQHDCCAVGGAGCEDLVVQARVCERDARCCAPGRGWSQTCVDLARRVGGVTCGG